MGNKDARTWAKTSISSRNSGHGATVRFSRILSTEFRSRIPRGFQGMEQGCNHLARRFGVSLVLVRKLKAKMVPGGLLWTITEKILTTDLKITAHVDHNPFRFLIIKQLCKFMHHGPADTPENIAVQFYCEKWRLFNTISQGCTVRF